MNAEGTTDERDKPRTLLGQILGKVATKLIIYVLLPGLGLLGYFIVDALGHQNPLGLKRDFAGMQVTGVVVVLLLATVLCLSVTAYFIVRESRRWGK